MNYTDLKEKIKELAEYNFTDSQLALFVRQTEQFVFQTIEFPVLRATASGTLTADQQVLPLPADFNWPYGITVTKDGKRHFLIDKDTTFLYEAYPDPTVTSLPKHYALSTDQDIRLGPVPDSNYAYELEYSRYPESITTAGTSWLGDFYDNVLLSGAMVEAARFNKLEQDIVAVYSTMFEQAMTILKNSGDGKLRKDAYRSGQTRSPAR